MKILESQIIHHLIIIFHFLGHSILYRIELIQKITNWEWDNAIPPYSKTKHCLGHRTHECSTGTVESTQLRGGVRSVLPRQMWPGLRASIANVDPHMFS